MKVNLKMSGLLARYLPAGGENGRTVVELRDGATVAGMIGQLGIPEEERLLVIVNDETVPADQRETHKLADDDRVSIVPPLKGG